MVFTSTAKLQTPHSNSNSGNKLQQRDTTLLKRIIYAPKAYHFWNWIMKYCSFLNKVLRKNLFARVTLFWKKKHHFLRDMRISNATFLKLNQFIEPKTTFAMFLSEFSSGKWSDRGHFLKPQGKFFLSFPCTLFLHIFDI